MQNKERRESIAQKVKQYTKEISCSVSSFKPKNNITEASFYMSHCIAHYGKLLCDGEFLTIAFLVNMTNCFKIFSINNK